MNDLNKLINHLIKEKGGTREQYINLLKKIGYHESAHTLDPTIKQLGGGPGRGIYQFEEGVNAGGITAARRTKRYLDSIGEPAPKWLNETLKGDSLDASQLSTEQQSMLFLGNMREHPKADFKKVWDGKETEEDFWANYHWAGDGIDRKSRLDSFSSSVKDLNNKPDIPFINTPAKKEPVVQQVNRPLPSNTSYNPKITQVDNTSVAPPNLPTKGLAQTYDQPMMNSGGFNDLISSINQKALGGVINKGVSHSNCGGAGQPPCKDNQLIQLNEVIINADVRNTPEWNAYKDSLYAYNNVNKLHDEGIDKFREEGLKNAKESSKEYWKNKDNFIYYDKLKSRAGDTRYDVPDKSFLGNAESDGYTAVFTDYDNGINKNYPHSIDNFTAEQMKKGINPMYFVPYGEGGGKGVFKKPTKPKEKSIGIDSKGINLEYPKTSTPELNLRTGIEKLPYNISTERTMSDDEGNRYGLHKGKVKQIQSRDEYRKANLRPNGEAFALGGNIEPDPPVKNKDFVTNWMSDPKTKGRLINNQGHTEGRAQELIDNSLMDLSTVNTYNLDHFKKPNKDIIKELGSGNSYMYDLKAVKDVKRTMKDTLVKGAYNPRLHSLVLRDEKDKGTIAHEKAHSMREFQDNQDKFIKEKFPVKDWNKENDFLKKKDSKLHKGIKSHKEYLDDDGLYPRIMDIRQQLNLKPGQTIDSSTLEGLKDRTPYEDMLEYYEDPDIVKILNTVADNSGNKKVNQAAQGGNISQPTNSHQLNSFNVGGLHDENKHGGIYQGMGANGKPNTVEQGETSANIRRNGKLSKFVFSNQISIDGSGVGIMGNINNFKQGGKIKTSYNNKDISKLRLGGLLDNGYIKNNK